MNGTGHPALARELPHALDAEKAVLGSLLLDAECFVEAAAILRDGAAEFWYESHRWVWETVAMLREQQRPIDGVIIKCELEQAGKFDRLGGYDYMGELTGCVPSAKRVAHYAEIMHEAYIRRRLADTGWNLSESAIAAKVAADAILRDATASLTRIAELTVAADATTSHGDFLDSVYADLENEQRPTIETGIRTGIFEVDSLVGDFEPGSLYLIGARPSRGKSAMAMQIAAVAAVHQARNVLYFSTEMTRRKLTERLLAHEARADYIAVQGKRPLSDDDRQRLREARPRVKAARIIFEDQAAPRLSQIAAKSVVHHKQTPLDLIIIDHAHQVEVDGYYDSETLRRGQVGKVAKRLSMDLELPVILCVQLNRGPEDRPDKRPSMSDIKASGDFEADANVILLPHQFYGDLNLAADDKPDTIRTGPCVIIVAKNRDGETSTVRAHWIGHHQRFEAQATQQQPYEPVATSAGQFGNGSWNR